MHQAIETEPTAAERVADCMLAIHQAAGELRNVPIYIVAAEALTGTDQAANVAYACTHRDLDIVLRPFVAWRGRGIGMIFSSQAIADDGGSLLAVLCHELSHAIVDGFACHRDETPVHAASANGLHAAAVRLFGRSDPLPIDNEYRGEIMPIHHGPEWCRVALHFRHRLAWRAEWSFGLHQLAIDPPLQRLHEFYLRSGEYEQYHFLTLHQIAKLPVSNHVAKMVREAWARAIA